MKLLSTASISIARAALPAVVLGGSLFANTAAAQLSSVDAEPSERDPGVEIIRSADELPDVLRRHPEDRDFINTALVLTDAGGRPSVAYCVAYNQRGEAVGRGFTKVPGNGVSLVFASDLSNGLDFIGKIRCKSRGLVSGTAFIVGAEFSDTRVHNLPLPERSGSLVTVPVAVTR